MTIPWRHFLLFFGGFWVLSDLCGQTEFNVQVRADDQGLAQTLSNLADVSQNGPLPAYRNAAPLYAGLKRVVRLGQKSEDTSRVHQRIYTLTYENGVSPTENFFASEFEWWEENRSVSLHMAPPNDSLVSDQWFHEYIKTFEAWDSTRGNSDIVIGILDTGLDYDHPEFEGQIHINQAEDLNNNGKIDPWSDTLSIGGVFGDFDGLDNDGNGYADDVIGYDFTDQPRSPFGGDYLSPDPDPLDDNNHGTLVAGIIGAKPNNQFGIAGIAPGCRLQVLRAFAANGSGEDDDIARAIVYAADNGVNILNFSFGDIYPSRIMLAAIRYAYSKGVIMVASAGNGTGDEVHYPSGFDEVISVSATSLSGSSNTEILWPLSSFGLTVSLSAPGSGILTTVIRDSTGNSPFDYFSGTSTSAPMVAAAAALLLSQRGICTPQQIRSILTISADDIGTPGWDHFTGAGRLNILAALQTVGAGNVQILSPVNDGGTANDSVWVVGTVLDPAFSQWHLEWQAGDDGQGEWNPILEARTRQKLKDTLGIWRVASLPDGVYTLRLRVDKTDGSTAEDRIRFVIDRTPPNIELSLVDHAWDNDRQKMLVVFRSDDPGRSVLHFRQNSGPFLQLPADRLTRNGEFLLDSDLLGAGNVELFVETVNASGLTGQSPLQNFNFAPGAVNTSGFDTTGAELPMGHYLDSPQDFDGDGLLEVVMSDFGQQLSFGPLRLYEYNGPLFSRIDSLTFKPILIPKDVADNDGDGLLELLCSVNDSMYVMEQSVPGGFPTEQRWKEEGNGYYAARFADVDDDGGNELLVKDFKDYFVFERSGNDWGQSTILPDNTPDYEGSVAPRVLVEDWDGNGKTDIAFGDFDGDFVIYEYDGSSYLEVFRDTTDFEKGGGYLCSGDFDGDGSPEIFSAVHSTLLRNEDFEYDSPIWLLRIFKATGQGNYQEEWRNYLYDIDTETYNAATSGNLDLDPADELIFTTFPRTYILEYDATNGYHFSWFHYGALCTDHMIGDFNGNGVNEFALGRGDVAFFFEKEAPNPGPEAPTGLTGQVTGDSTVRLTWTAETSAVNGYRVWRGLATNLQSVQIALIDSTANLFFDDSGLLPGQRYLYVIQSKNTGMNPVYSDFSNFILLRPHAPGRLDSVSAHSAYLLETIFSVPVGDDPGQLPWFRIDGSQFPSSLVSQGENRLLLGLDNPLSPGQHILEIDSFFLDADLAPLAPNFRSDTFFWFPQEDEKAFLTHWEAISDKEAELFFNLPMDTSAVNPAHFQLFPLGNISAVNWIPGDSTGVRVTIEDAAFGALGYPLSIVLSGMRSGSGAYLDEKEGNIATFTSFSETVSGIYVYPNPVEPNEFFDGLRFANLPAVCTITVISVNGRHIADLSETNGDGGYTWDMTDAGGNRIKPGKYIFRVVTPEGETFLGKFAVLDR